MKLRFNKIKILLVSCLALVAVAFGTLALNADAIFSAKAAGTTLTSTEYGTDGASMRIFRSVDDVDATPTKGLRFHVEMGDGYAYNNQLLIEDTSDNAPRNEDNGSFILNDNFKTYTIILPTRLLNGELTINTPSVLKLDTSKYWYKDANGNLESIAYVYNIPTHRFTDNFSFRGVICDANGNVLAQTPVQERCVAEIARKSYDATLSGDEFWGDAINTEGKTRNEVALDTLKSFIPVYNVVYKTTEGEVLKEEDVLWGNLPTGAPEGHYNAWYCEDENEEVDFNKALTYEKYGAVTFTATKATTFTLTGVATESDFTVNGASYNGVKIFATLHKEAFANKTELDVHAVNVEHLRDGKVLHNGLCLQGVWTMEENGQMRLFFALDHAMLVSGDQIRIKGDSVFYYNGTMYELTEDYLIDYTKTDAVEDYSMFLGHLYNSDIKSLTNCSEDSTGNNGAPDEFTIRIEFYEDVMINGEFTFEFGPDSDTTNYPYPVFIRCGEDPDKLIPVSGGRYYWNEGNHKILELIGAGEYENKVFGWHNGDELIGAPGTIIKQNGGYYIFEDEMYAYFLASGVDTWGYVQGNWLVGTELAKFTSSEFDTQGNFADYDDDGTPAQELRITTATHWFPNSPKVHRLTIENMSSTEPYGVYHTAKNGDVCEVERIVYHGQANENGGYFHIIGFRDLEHAEIGETVTIVGGTRFWLASDYYTVTETTTYYYTGSHWARNFSESSMGTLTSASFETRAHNQGDGEVRLYFTSPLNGYTTENNGAFDTLTIGTGSITFNGTPVSYLRYQRWDAGSTWLAVGGTDMAGKIAFGDKLVIEEGTTIWSNNNVAYKFTEKVEWIYVANPADSNRTWSAVIDGVTTSVDATNASVCGSGKLAVGQTYTLTVSPATNCIVSEVVINGISHAISANDQYTFTVQANNTINVKAVVGNKVTFSIPENVVVDGGAITNGTIKVVSSGDSLTFSAVAQEGYKIVSVSNATNNGDGTYTVTPSGSVTVSFVVSKLYKVTYSGDNAAISANVANGSWVDNGTQVNLTIVANSGYSIISVSNATKNSSTEYIATVMGADLNVEVITLKSDSFIDLTNSLTVEDRAWASDNNKVIVLGLMKDSEYFKSKALGTWYKGNNDIIPNNGGVDILQYIYVNGQSARDLINSNTSGQHTVGTGSWLSNPAAWPIAVDTNGDVWIRLDRDKFGSNFTFTIKAGFRIIDINGNLVAVTKDINIKYANGSISKEIDEGNVVMHEVSFNLGSGILVNGGAISNGTVKKIESGTPFVFDVSAMEGYKLLNVTGATDNGDGTYTVTPTSNAVVTITSEKLYKVTCSNSNVTFNGNVANGAWVENGTVVEATITANTGHTLIEVNGVEKLNANTYRATVNGANLEFDVLTLANSKFVDISDRLAMEDRSWGAHSGEAYVAFLDTGILQSAGNYYLMTNVNGTWYVGNNDIIAANGGVDIMEYLLINGKSARAWIEENANGERHSNACGCWLSNPAAYPVYVETTNHSGLMMRFATDVFGTNFTVTVLSGFRTTNSNGDLIVVTKDIDFIYNNATITKQDYWKSVALKTMKANIGKYTNGALTYTESTDTFNSVSDVGSVTLSAELFEMLNYYGYSTMEFVLTVRAHRTTTSLYEWQIMKGQAQILFVDNNEDYDKTVSTSANGATKYEVQYRESSTSAWKIDNKSIWTIASINII